MINLGKLQPEYFNFYLEAIKHPELQLCIDKQFEDCLLASLSVHRLGCQISRDTLPFCGKILKITQFVFDHRNEHFTLFEKWSRILECLCQKDGITVERYGLPPTQFRFPLSRAVFKGKNVTFDEISFLDSSNNDILEKIIKYSLRFTNQSCGPSVFSAKSLRMMLRAPNTLCAYSTTVKEKRITKEGRITEEGRITSVMWGVKLQIQQLNEMVPCFYILYAVREPEYGGRNIYEKMFSAFYPLLVKEGDFKSEILCWKQGKNNEINNKALEKYKGILGEVSRSEGEPYTCEATVNCSLKLNQHSTFSLPTNAALEKALEEYALDAGDFLTFACEYPLFVLRNKFWDTWYNTTFSTQKDYQNSLQPIRAYHQLND